MPESESEPCSPCAKMMAHWAAQLEAEHATWVAARQRAAAALARAFPNPPPVRSGATASALDANSRPRPE